MIMSYFFFQGVISSDWWGSPQASHIIIISEDFQSKSVGGWWWSYINSSYGSKIYHFSVEDFVVGCFYYYVLNYHHLNLTIWYGCINYWLQNNSSQIKKEFRSILSILRDGLKNISNSNIKRFLKTIIHQSHVI